MYVESKRVEYLDSIRGVAAWFVLLSHTSGAFAWPAAYGALAQWPFISILFDGKESVCMFFVLSGYVLSKPYLPAPGSPAPRRIFLPTFYARRLTRIWLPWFSIFLLSLMAKKYAFHPVPTDPTTSAWLDSFWHAPMTPGDFLQQCAFRLHDGSRQLLVQDWSLGVELKGSALIPLFVFLLAFRRGLPWLLLLGAVFPFLTESGHYYASFVLGVVLARCAVPIIQHLPQGRLTRGGLLVLGLTAYQCWGAVVEIYPNQRMPGQIGWIITSLGCALILLAVFSSPSLQAWLNRKPMVFLGRVSYSVYLLQFIIILCLLPPLVRLGNHCGLTPGPGLFILTLLASSAATIAAAALTYRLIEVPAINLGHQLTKQLQKRFQK